MDDETNNDDNIVQLNVGGCLYTTSRSTLTLNPGSMLATMITGQLPSSRDGSGAYIIDRDGPTFRYVLNFLRQGELKLPADYKDLGLLAVEADFYQIEKLIEAVAETVKANEVSSVNLNVGGSLYTTTRSTLTCYPHSMLGQMFSGRIPSIRDFSGAYVIDGDGPTFRYVLNFLRRGKLILTEDFKEWDLLATEADFYQIGQLIDAVKAEKFQRIIPEEDMQDFEYIKISHNCEVDLEYTYTGSRIILEQIPRLLNFFIKTAGKYIVNHKFDRQQKLFLEEDPRRYILDAVEDHGTWTHVLDGSSFLGDSFEDGFKVMFREISQLGFKLKKRSMSLDSSDELSWTFARKIEMTGAGNDGEN